MLIQPDSRFRDVVHYFIVLLVAVFVYMLAGMDRVLVHDDAMYLYGGQQLLRGYLPYAGIFDAKGPLAQIINGAYISIGRFLDLDDVISARLGHLLLSVLSCLTVFALARRLLSSLMSSYLAAFSFIGFETFTKFASSGPNAKTSMVFFEVVFFLCVVSRRWYLCGLFGGMAFLVWQPSGVLLAALGIALLCFGETNRDRVRSIAFLTGGFASALVVVVVPYLLSGRLGLLLDGLLLFTLFDLDRGDGLWWHGVFSNLQNVFIYIRYGYPYSAHVFLFGGLGVAVIGLWAVQNKSVIPAARNNVTTLALFMSFFFMSLWTLNDIQGPVDLFFFLPLLAIGFGWIFDVAVKPSAALMFRQRPLHTLVILTIIVSSLVSAVYGAWTIRSMATTKLADQRRWVHEIVGNCTRPNCVLSLGNPEFLAIAGFDNGIQYSFIGDGIDNYIERTEPGGFLGWLEDIKGREPDMVLLGTVSGDRARMDAIITWLNQDYIEDKGRVEATVGNWRVFVRRV